MNIRIGTGIDYHILKEGLPFTLGGVEIPHYKGPEGHSDADVLLHAICDALLGAAALGDIGKHFPNTDATLKGIDSKILLRRTNNLIKEHGYNIINIDSTVCLELPKIAPHIPKMTAIIADILGIDVGDVSIKATTTEKLGFAGREEGLFAQASVLIQKL